MLFDLTASITFPGSTVAELRGFLQGEKLGACLPLLQRKTLRASFKTRVDSMGPLSGSVGWASDFGSGHDLAVCEFEPCVGLCADGSEPGACFGFCVSLSLCPSPTPALSFSPSQK